jgi:hypothetical protein
MIGPSSNINQFSMQLKNNLHTILDVVDFNRSHIKCGWIYSKSSSTHESKYSNKNHPFQGLGPS